jgi:hypothetical protein
MPRGKQLVIYPVSDLLFGSCLGYLVNFWSLDGRVNGNFSSSDRWDFE